MHIYTHIYIHIHTDHRPEREGHDVQQRGLAGVEVVNSQVGQHEAWGGYMEGGDRLGLDVCLCIRVCMYVCKYVCTHLPSIRGGPSGRSLGRPSRSGGG